MAPRVPTRTPPPTEPPLGRAPSSAILDAVEAADIDLDTDVHVAPLGPKASPFEQLQREVRVEGVHRAKADKALLAELREVRGDVSRLAGKLSNWNVYLFGLDGGSGHFARLDAVIENMKANQARIEATHATDKLETHKRLEGTERVQWKLMTLAGAAGVVGGLALQVVLRLLVR